MPPSPTYKTPRPGRNMHESPDMRIIPAPSHVMHSPICLLPLAPAPSLKPHLPNPHTQTIHRHHPISTPYNTISPTPLHQYYPPPLIVWPRQHSTDYPQPDRTVNGEFPPT